MTEETPSQWALSMADLVSNRAAFSGPAAGDLIRLLGPTLAEPHYAAKRWDTLGALVTMIGQGDGQLPTVREYEAFRTRSHPDAPAASTRTERYGTWLSALNSASHLMSLSRTSPVWPYKKRIHPPYTPAQCLAALAQFRKRFGDWPRPTEYREWARSARRTAHECGANDPNLPDLLKVILRRFGTFDRALRAAQSLYDETRWASATPA